MDNELMIPAKHYAFATTAIEQNSNLPPQFAEQRGKKYALYGETNNYFDYLVELYDRSSTHAAIINGKHKYILGRGLIPGENAKYKDADIKAFLESANQYGQSLMDVLDPTILDWLITGGFSIKIKKKTLTGKPELLYHKSMGDFRLTNDDKRVMYSEFWTFDQYGRPQTQREPKGIETFDKWDWTGTQKEGIIYHRDSRPGMRFYPLPEYRGSIQDIETEILIAEFHNNNTKSGFSAGYIIEFTNGVPTLDEQAELIRDFKQKYTEARNSGEVMVVFSDMKERGVNVIPIRPNDIDKQFEVLRRDVTQSLITNGSITSPMLLAIKTEGQLGGSTELLNAAELFQNTYVTHKQEKLVKYLDKIFMQRFGYNPEFQFLKLEPVKKTLSESAVIKIMTDDEIREAAGLPPLTPEQIAEKEAKAAAAAAPVQMRGVIGKGIDELLYALRSSAIDLDGEIIAERACLLEDDFSDEAERLFLRSYQMNVGLYDLPYYQSLVYEFLSLNSGSWSIAEISNRIIVSEENVRLALEQLQKENYLNYKEGKDGKLSSIKLNPISDAPLQKPNIPLYQLVTRWKYDGPNDERTRDFCKAMLNDPGLAGKLWKREDINNLSTDEGRNVWLTRGGWYTLPNGNKRPSCRHYWKQVIVRIKN